MERELAQGKHRAAHAADGRFAGRSAREGVQAGRHAAASFTRSSAHGRRAGGKRVLATLLTVPACAIVVGLGAVSIQNGTGHADDVMLAQNPDTQIASVQPANANGAQGSQEAFILETGATRNVDAVVEAVQYEEEQARLAAEAAEREAEQEAIAQAQQAQQLKSSAAVGIGDVDFSVGHDAFMEEWTARIDDYLAGSPLAGYGADFAQAAWDNGVDPRWSPAISCTESTKGAHCYAAYNAWGWTGYLGSSWPNAIHAHVAGLARGYGHTITYANAAKYCPPNTDHWYRTTLGEMAKI